LGRVGKDVFFFKIDCLMEMNFLPGLLADRKPVNGGTGYIPPQSPGGGQASPNATKEQSTMTIIKTALFIFRILENNYNYVIEAAQSDCYRLKPITSD
jgi:hypothetical protein